MENKTKMPSILILDDEVDISEVLGMMLSTDFQIDRCNSFKEFQEKFLNHPFDLIITDLKLPDCSGCDVLNFVNKQAHPIPLVIMSGYDENNEEIISMLEKGASFLIKKPFENIPELIPRLKKLVKQAL
jgi:two-component system response regulator HydG